MNAEDFLAKNILPSMWHGDILLPFPSKQYHQCYSMSLWAVLSSCKDVVHAWQPREERHAAKEHEYSNFPSFTIQCFSRLASPDFCHFGKTVHTFYETLLEGLQASSPSYQQHDAFAVI